MKYWLLLHLFFASFAEAKSCSVDAYLQALFQPEDPHHIGIYYQYGTANIPSARIQTAIAELPVINVKRLDEDILNHYKSISKQNDGNFTLAEPYTKPSSGARVFMIQKDGENVAVAKIFGDDFHALFRESTASDYLKRNEINGSQLFGEANFKVDGHSKAFSFLTLAKGKDINLELNEVSLAFKKLTPTERTAFSQGKYKNLDEIPPAVKHAKNRFNIVASAIEGSSQELAKLHHGQNGGGRFFEEYEKRRAFILRKVEKQYDDLLSLPTSEFSTSKEELEKLVEEIKKTVHQYQTEKIPPELISVTHGDAHTGNFIYNSETNQAAMIDNQSLVNSFGPGTGAWGINESTSDLALLMESVAVKAKNGGFTDNEIRFLQQKALKIYLSKRNLNYSAIAPSLDFHRLRFDMIIATGKGSSIPKAESAAALHELLVRYQIRK